MGSIGLHRALFSLASIRFYRVLQVYRGFYRVLQTGFCGVFAVVWSVFSLHGGFYRVQG